MRVLQFAVMGAALLVAPAGARAHGGHADAPSAETASGATTGVVRVSEAARENLDLQLAEAELRPIEAVLTVIGEIAPVPGRSGTVASRIPGRVVSLSVAEGDAVRKGQPVVEVESLQVGDPPPRVRYPAPLDGVVIDRHHVIGESVEPNGHILEIADLSEVLAVGRVFEGQIERVRVGQAVRVAVPSFPGRSFEGVVERLGGQLDPASRSLPVYVRVKNPELRLRPNMRAVLSVVTDRAETALAVPRGAVLGEFGASFVFVEDEGDPTRFERRPVVTGLADDRWVEVLDGLLPADRVVTEGNYSLQFLPSAPAKEEGKAEPHASKTKAESAASGGEVVPWLAVATAMAVALASLAFVLRSRMRRGGA